MTMHLLLSIQVLIYVALTRFCTETCCGLRNMFEHICLHMATVHATKNFESLPGLVSETNLTGEARSSLAFACACEHHLPYMHLGSAAGHW